MGSDYQLPQSLSLSNSSRVRDPSFSLYLNGADEEIGVFSADKYFSEEFEDAQKPNLRRSEGSGDSVSGPVRSKISLGTPSNRSELSSWHSQTALLHSFPNQIPGRHSTGEVQRKKSFLSRICCRCSCVSNKSLKVTFRHSKSQDCTGQTMNRADQLLQITAPPARKPWMKDSNMMFYPSATPPHPNLLKGGQEESRYTTDSFEPPAKEKIKKSISIERRLDLLNWDELNPSSADLQQVASTTFVEYYTDAESDTSSDLFEIERFTGHRKPSFSSHIPHSTESGYATPTTCYAPSEASIDWSVVTASAADFSMLSDCEDYKPPMPVPKTRSNRDPVNEKYHRHNENAGLSLMGCTNHKGVRVLENVDLQKTKENINCHPRIHMDKFVPFSRV